jgi:zinc protease
MDRKIAPAFKQAQSLELIFPEKIELENGIRLYWMRDVKDESVKLDIEWFAGTKYQSKLLTAGFTNKLLLSGNDKRTAKDIAADIDFYGGYAQDEVDKDHASLTLYGLRENFARIFDIFQEAMTTCTFPDKEFEEERTIALSKFKIDSEKVKYICQRKFNEVMFGRQHPYGNVAGVDDFLALKREDLISFYQQFYLNSAPVLFLVGNVDEAIVDQLRAWSARLGKGRVVFEVPAAKPVFGRTEVVKRDAIQTAIRIGRLAVDKNHPDYFGLQLLDTILGGYFGSRLMTNIREDKGYTYGIGSGVAVLENASYFFISTEVAKAVKEATITEIYNELERLKTDLVPEDELERVKNYMLGEFLRHSDGPAAMMESFKNIWFNHLKDSYYSDFIAAIHRLTAEDLRSIAQTYFVKDKMVEVIAG